MLVTNTPADELWRVAESARLLHEAMVKNMTWILHADAEELGRLAQLAQALSKVYPEWRP